MITGVRWRAIRSAMLTVALLIPPGVLADSWRVDKSESRLGFTAEFEGIPFDGVFRQWQAHIVFDPAQTVGNFEVRVQPGSVDSNLTERDDALRLDEWFAVARFPEALFSCSRFESLNEGFRCAGELSLKGRSQPVKVDFHWVGRGEQARLKGGGSLERLDFAIGEGEDFLGDDIVGHRVEVWFDLVLIRD